MNLAELLTLTRDLLNEASASQWTDADLVRKINVRHKYLSSQLITTSVGYFIRNSDFSLVANQEDYDLPANCHRVHRIERIDGTYPVELRPVSASELWRYRTVQVSTFRDYACYWIFGEKIKILPVPASAATNAIRCWYVKKQPELNTGTLSAAASTSATLPAAPTGTLSKWTSAYEGMWLEIVSGTGAGQRRKITAYNADTRVASVATWTVTPTGAVYALVPEIPDQYHDLLAYGAAIDALIEAKDEAGDMKAIYDEYERQFKADVALRQEQEPRRVKYVEP